MEILDCYSAFTETWATQVMKTIQTAELNKIQRMKCLVLDNEVSNAFATTMSVNKLSSSNRYFCRVLARLREIICCIYGVVGWFRKYCVPLL